jgi:CRISPR-associated protein, csn1 family
MKKFEDYYLGIDLGTSSIGWAVTNEKYDILRFNKKFMWGTHLFDTGNTAAERRIFRTSRRRLKRKKKRIELLQTLFSEEISKKDFGFFQRLKESQYFIEDKTIKNKNILFMDKNYTDQDYHMEYPTIYHLRKALIDNEESAFEIRKLYLAISHILSHRGHFLFEGGLSDNLDFDDIFNEFVKYLNEELNIDFKIKSDVSLRAIKEILTDKMLNKKKKKEKLSELLEEEKNKIYQEIWKLLVGNEAKMSTIFDDKEYEEAKIAFSKGNYDEKEEEYESILGEKILFVQKAKAIYDWMLLQNILKEDKYLSYSKVKLYDEHKNDLRILKEVLKRLDKKVYKEIFSENGLYENYVKKNGKEELYKKIKSYFNDENSDEIVKNILNKIELDSFLPKQKIKDNGVIPRQVHQKELEIILKNAEKYFSWLTKKDETGLSVSEKIMKIFKFKIPYYVGPLNSKSPFAWIERKEYGKILPWNFENMVDISKTAEKFIKRMTNKCTYLPEKDVIPKNSLLYTKYMVLNELNNLKIRGEKIKVELKQKIYTELFQKNKKIGMKTLIEFLKSQNIVVTKAEITGIDGTFNTSLGSYIDMRKIFGEEKIVKDSYKKMIEDIILWITLYGEEKKLIKSKIEEKYPEKVTPEEMKLILKLKYKDWSRLSKEFLTEIETIDEETGEFVNIIEMLWRKNENIMELLSYKYDFSDRIKEYNGINEEEKNITYEDLIKDLQVSPSVKKMIWRALVIVKEIKKVTKKSPKKVFIEMARDHQTEKKRTDKRKDKLLELYKNIKNDDSIKELEKNLKEKTNDELKSKKLYLYYLQLGRCMYSGEVIRLEDLMNDNLYDIDHIYPQSKIKDDSFDNTVLVKKQINADKTDEYPIDKNIQNKCKAFWTSLKERGLMSNTKYERLTRTEGFSDDELAGFISRQLVETRQATKILANLLKVIFGSDTRIIYVKAGLTSDFRQKFGIYKFRELNDYHHAHDGYLNIITGNIYNTLFTDNPYNFIKDRKKINRSYNLNKVFERENDVWNPNSMILKVERYIYKIRPLFTRASYEQKGGFSDQNISSKKDKLRPLKLSGVLSNTKYGGYDKIKNSYFFIVEYTEKKKRIRSIETLPIYIKNFIKTKNDLEKYCKENLKLQEPKILISKLNYKSLIYSNGHKYYINSKTLNNITIQNGIQLILTKENYETYRKIYKNLEYLKLIYKDEKIREKKFLEKLSKILKKNKFSKDLSENEISEKINELYKEIFEKIERGIFSKFKSTLPIYIKDCNDLKDFSVLNNYNKSRFIQEILKCLNSQQGEFDTKYTHNYSKKYNMKLSKSKILENDFYIINQSPTGLFEKKVFLDK